MPLITDSNRGKDRHTTQAATTEPSAIPSSSDNLLSNIKNPPASGPSVGMSFDPSSPHAAQLISLWNNYYNDPSTSSLLVGVTLQQRLWEDSKLAALKALEKNPRL